MDIEETKILKAAITAVGGYTPKTILSNKKLEKMVETTDEWIKTRTGIKERRILNAPDKATSFLAIKAANDRTYYLLKIMKNKNCENVDLVNSEILKNTTQTVAGQLSILREMFKSGDLTKEEFTKAKKKVLESE